jgi:hypothetical protein
MILFIYIDIISFCFIFLKILFKITLLILSFFILNSYFTKIYILLNFEIAFII